jgi:hypothetical protein
MAMPGVDLYKKVHQTHGFHVVDAILFAPFQPLL